MAQTEGEKIWVQEKRTEGQTQVFVISLAPVVIDLQSLLYLPLQWSVR